MAHLTSTFTLTLTLTLILTLTAGSTTPTSDTTRQQQKCTLNFSGQRDVVFLFDTSTSVHRNWLKRGKDAGKTLIRNSMVVRPNNTRLAAITFDKEVSVAFDYVTDTERFLYECELFSPEGMWESSVQFEGGQGENLAGGMDMAGSVFKTGKTLRPHVKQDLIVISDAHDIFNNIGRASDIKAIREELMRFEVNIYGIGVGERLNSTVFQQRIASDPCYYLTADDWNNAMNKREVFADEKEAVRQVEDGYGVWRRVQNISICGDSCERDEMCACREFSNVAYSLSSPECIDSEDEDDFNLWTAVLAILFTLLGIFFFIAVIACVLWARVKVKDKQQPLRHMEQQMSSEPQMQRNEYEHQRSPAREQEEIYENGIVATVIQGHSLDRQGPNSGQGHLRRNMHLPAIPAEQGNQAYDYVQAGSRPLSEIQATTEEEGAYVNIDTPDLRLTRGARSLGGGVDVPNGTSNPGPENGQTTDYVNDGFVSALQRRFKQLGKKVGGGRSRHNNANTPSSTSSTSVGGSQNSHVNQGAGSSQSGATNNNSDVHSARSRSSWKDLFKSSRHGSAKHDYENEGTINQLRQNAPPEVAASEGKKSNRSKVGTGRFKMLRGLFESSPAPVMGMAQPGSKPSSPVTVEPAVSNSSPVFNFV